MRKASIGVTAEGAPSIVLSAFCCLIFAILDLPVLAVLFLLLTAFCGHFFRDPERVPPSGKDIAVSPADGKVVRVGLSPDPFSGEMRKCIGIFMNVFNVHVNRSPVDGVVVAVKYHPGRFLNAGLDKSSQDNERCAYLIQTEDGATWSTVQVAGLIARRIVCRVNEGDVLRRGERFGMIKFGSRVDIYLPDGYHPSVLVGDTVLAGQTPLAAKTE